MLNLKDKLRENLARLNINKLSMSAFCISTLESFFNKKFEIEGTVKNNILFIKPKNGFLKTEIFLKKATILEKINENLEKFGYKQKIIDVIVKS